MAVSPYYLPMERFIGQQTGLTGKRQNELLGSLYGEELRNLYSTQTSRRQQTLAETQSAQNYELANRGLNLQEQQIANTQRAQTASTLTSVPTTLMMTEYLTKDPTTGKGMVSGAYEGVKEWLTGTPSKQRILAPTVSGASPIAGYGVEAGIYNPASEIGAGVGPAGATSYMPVVGWSAAAGSLGAKYGPGGSEYVGELTTFGMGGSKEKKVVGGMVKGAGAGAIAGTIIMPGVGTIIGTVVGAITGGITEGTVICTELHRQGYVSQEILDLEKKYQSKFDSSTYWGYRLWADPVVKGMQKSSLITKIVAPFGMAFLKEIAHRVEPEREGSRFGSLVLKIGVPLCRWNYKRVMKTRTAKALVPKEEI